MSSVIIHPFLMFKSVIAVVALLFIVNWQFSEALNKSVSSTLYTSENLENRSTLFNHHTCVTTTAFIFFSLYFCLFIIVFMQMLLHGVHSNLPRCFEVQHHLYCLCRFNLGNNLKVSQHNEKSLGNFKTT